MRKGFTLVELIIVIVIIGILASVGVGQYGKIIEKSRAAEARTILGTLRTLQINYKLENEVYSAKVTDLESTIPSTCAATHYFSYGCADTGACTATRCEKNGKTPNIAKAYTKTLAVDGTWTGNAEY